MQKQKVIINYPAYLRGLSQELHNAGVKIQEAGERASEIIAEMEESANQMLIDLEQLRRENTIGNDGTGRTLAQIERDAQEMSPMNNGLNAANNLPAGSKGE